MAPVLSKNDAANAKESSRAGELSGAILAALGRPRFPMDPAWTSFAPARVAYSRVSALTQ
jgi:hypothetical protein